MLPGETVGANQTKCFDCNATMYLAVCCSGAGYYLGFMWDIKRVCLLSDGWLSDKDCLEIMKNYSTYREKYGQEVKAS